MINGIIILATELGNFAQITKEFDEKHAIIFNGKIYDYPTAEQMIGWLEEKGMFVSIIYTGFGVNKEWVYNLDSEEYKDYNGSEYSSLKEATLSAIDAALNYLTNKNK